MDEEGAVFADFDALDVLWRVFPGEVGVGGEELPRELVAHSVDVVGAGDVVALGADAAVVAPFANHADGRVFGQGELDGLDQDSRDRDVLPEDGRVDLPGLGREVKEALDHVAAEHDDALVDRVVGALELGDGRGLVAEAEDAVAHDARVVGGGPLAALPVREVPEGDLAALLLRRGLPAGGLHAAERELGVVGGLDGRGDELVGLGSSLG